MNFVLVVGCLGASSFIFEAPPLPPIHNHKRDPNPWSSTTCLGLLQCENQAPTNHSRSEGFPHSNGTPPGVEFLLFVLPICPRFAEDDGALPPAHPDHAGHVQRSDLY